jgi:nucleotide-binding universal stress UspA family protein
MDRQPNGNSLLPLERILFPVDFSGRDLAFAPYVEVVARRFDSEVILLNVTEWKDPYDALHESAAGIHLPRLDDFLRGSFQGISVKREQRKGDAAKEIVDYAHSQNVNAIMLPTAGRGAFRRFILGSVSAKVLHDADCPVWTDAHSENATPARRAEIRHILCAVDSDEKAIPTLRAAAELAEFCGATITVLHVIPGPRWRRDSQSGGKLPAYLFDEVRAELEAAMDTVGIRAELRMEGGEIPQAVRQSARQIGCDLVLIGRARTGLMGRLRTHGYAIIRESACPVLSV